MSNLRLVKTCSGCPEQYDVFLGYEQVGYLRLRNGSFRADCPDCGGETVYESTANGDGIFNDDERPIQLAKAMSAIERWIEGNPQRSSS